ncbi:hypothetical protein CRV00_05440 [Malaciobacter molluscorum]|uniref:type II secretion system protein n=1 Tax=Malaciobacter molluscorum TaxID=1032072 RepID=UPI00100C2C29|nr:type II secretion system protein [Malaciobacter molluscorum]RXJ95196.1 hypothetical protein CRV00_05440 [Malaciobacter molluscorum]
MKKSFSVLELIFAITLLSLCLLSFSFNPTNLKIKKIDLATNRLLLYLKQTRYQALLDDKYENNNKLWHKKRWTLKFFNCRNNKGIYYVIYSDENMTGHPNKTESLKDPLTNKYIYSSNKCEYDNTTSKYVLLTNEFDINKVNVSCKTDSSLGKISFGIDGYVYKKLSNKENESKKYRIKKECKIIIEDKEGEKRVIRVGKRGEMSTIFKI